jgi:putative two-component system response regulator
METIELTAERIPGLGREERREAIMRVVARLEGIAAQPGWERAVEDALALCRKLYHHAHSAEALTVARAALAEAQRGGSSHWVRRAATACGIVAADTLDLVGAIEYHVIVLRSAMESRDAVEASRTWNNLGLAMGISGHYELAGRCYRRSLELVAAVPGAVYSRHTAFSSLAHCLYRAGTYEEGLSYAFLALEEETEGIREQDLHSALYLRRNLVRLLIACGRLDEADVYVGQLAGFAERLKNPRAAIALAIAQGSLDLALGRTDVALTRLEGALARAREVPPALHDTLVTLVRAEEAAGNIQRALLRLEELTQHVYRVAVERARQHVELSQLDPAFSTAIEQMHRQSKARLAAKSAPPAQPEAWPPLERLAVSAALRMDGTGWHGKRVGALVKGLAMASGSHSLQALEMGLASELHDIGMLSIPDDVLQSDSPDNTQRGILRRHVEAGAEMLRDDSHPRVFMAREIAQYHHARWDGEGHPSVGGRRIPLAARACAIADAYDEMLCGIDVRKPLSMQDALGEIRAESGGRFDPELVGCFDRFILTESEDLGVDFASSPGLEGFQSLVTALREDRGFV